jgi:succinate-semialdehyde dehydrogenase/glutarate-semialdehyde dehydrogenase
MTTTPAATAGSPAVPARDPFLGSEHVDAALLGRLARLVGAGADAARLVVGSPATGGPLAELPRSSPDDVRAAVAAARAAQPAWAALPVAERGRIIRRYGELVLDRQEEILDLLQVETGKARPDAFEEVAETGVAASYYGHKAPRVLRPDRRRGALPLLTRTRVNHHPIGVVGVVAPWNYPLVLSVNEALPALVAGNAVVIKPDVKTTFTALWAAGVLREAGLDPALVQVVTGDGPDVGPALIGAVDYVAFTGSTRVGRLVAEQAARRLIGCSLELGGKNAMVVLADADLGAAVDGAVRGCFANAGQLCVSFERIYVERAAYDGFVDRLAERASAIRLLPGLDWAAGMGSLISPDHLAKVDEHVAEAVAKGATVRAGGRARPDLGPSWYEPTVLTGVAGDMRLCAEETFGPVVAVYPVDGEDEAVARANASSYGLSGSVWTRDARRGRRVAGRLAAGTVSVNDAYAPAYGSVDAPMGGMKESGIGRRHGVEGIRKFTESQTVAVQRVAPIAAPPGMAPARYARLLTRALRLLDRIPGMR